MFLTVSFETVSSSHSMRIRNIQIISNTQLNIVKSRGFFIIELERVLKNILLFMRKEGRMTKEIKTQWHPAFCSAVKLELIENKDDLDYENEYNLNSKPIQIDLLVIKKSKDVEIKNEIGKIFRGHNILEYKSPQDSMNVDTFIKVIAYACLYKASEVHVNDICLEDITITLIRERRPRELFKWFTKHGYEICEKYPGIYYVNKDGNFPIQVIVSSRLAKENLKPEIDELLEKREKKGEEKKRNELILEKMWH